MAFDKAKVVRAAEKFLAQGKISAAIKEYRQIVDNDDDDLTALNMLGDLYARNGKPQEAIPCFTRIAEHYYEKGFPLKAVAMYRKVDRLQPNDPAIASTLAALYEMQGLIVDARAQYMIVAEAFLKGGQAHKALEVLRKIADLEPHNTDIRLRLAEGYVRENLYKEAAEAFSAAGDQFLARRNCERALACFGDSLKLHPGNTVALNGILNAHIQLGTADEAAEILEQALSKSPHNVELLSMLAHAYVESEDADKAESSTRALVEDEISSFPRFIDVARLYLNDDRTEDTVRILAEIADRVLAEGEVDRFKGILDEVLARNPEHLDALKILVRVSKWQCDEAKTRSALERLVEAAEVFGNVEVERSALAQLAQLVPDARYLDRLEMLGGAPEALVYPNFPGTTDSSNDAATFESFALVDENSFEDSAGSPSTPGVEFEWNAADESVPAPDNSFADLNEEHIESSGSVFETHRADAVVSSEEENEYSGLDSRQASMLKQELESVDFYLAQGYEDIARDTLDMLERQFGAHSAIDKRRSQLFGASEIPNQPAPSETVEESGHEFTFSHDEMMDDGAPVESSSGEGLFEVSPNGFEAELGSLVDEPVLPAPARGGGIDPGLAAIFDEFREAVEDDEPVAGEADFETHYNMGLAYKEMDLTDQAVEEFQRATSMVSAGDGTPRYLQCCNMLGHCFLQKDIPRLAIMWFKRGLEAPGHSEDEYQALRYDLGSAYEQMGEIDTAIDIFTEVYGVNVSYRGVAEKLRELQTQRAVK